MNIKIPKGEKRTLEQIKQHYEIEKELAAKLRYANKNERKNLYSSLYDELFRRVPAHPQNTRKQSPEEAHYLAAIQLKLLKRFFNKDSTFLEIGSGDCSFSILVSDIVSKVYAVDVSQEIVKHNVLPKNLTLIINDGFKIGLHNESVDIAYSSHLIEHFHPEDIFDHLREIYRVLKPGGRYVIITPNRLNGPHDISRYFDEVATGFHLKEYTFRELYDILYNEGFTTVNAYIGGKGFYLPLQPYFIICFEKIINYIPSFLKKSIARSILGKALLNIHIIGTK